MFKKVLVTACIIITGFPSVAQSAILLDRVVAIVNKEVITWSDLYREMEFDASDQVRAMKDEDRLRFFKANEMSFLEGLIDLKLQLQEAAKEGITTSDADVAAAVQNIKSKYSMSDEIFNETIRKDGFTPETYKKKLSEQITVNRVVDQEVRSKMLVTEHDVDAYLAGNKDAVKDLEGFDISHILLKKTGDDKQLEQRAWDIYKKLQAGESFAELAKRYSDDPSARGGGALGFVRRCDMSKEFLNVCLSVKPGDISEPLWRNDGIYIIRVNEAKVFKSEQDMREAIRQKLLNEKFSAALKNWARELRDKAYVEIKT
ncbi:MAG TPA: peptidylprolyl isomerase [Dissulfurispiraceae bacterium]|nr:peptidylprolyl isomerase [Dissulfurispiraceae bacterium]